MKTSSCAVVFTSVLVSFLSGAAADERTEDTTAEKSTNTCALKLRSGGKCEGDECPYQVTLPPMAIQLPKQFGLLEKTLKEVQSLKETVNKMKKSCQDRKLQADDNQDRKNNELQVPDAEGPTDSSHAADNKIQELQTKFDKMSASLKNARSQISALHERLERLSPVSVNSLESYVDSKVENLTYVLASLDNRCASNCPALEANLSFQLLNTDCSDHFKSGKRLNGIYRVTPDPKNKTFEVYCDMESMGGGWTVIQRRQDGSTHFNRTWNEYKAGFGNLSNEYWLGNDKIHLLTKSADMLLRIELEDFNSTREYAKYEQFYVANEFLKYRLSVSGYSGTAGDALHFSKQYNHDQKFFTTADRDNDRYPSGNCGAYYSSGWWFDACMASNLNGKYYHAIYKGVRNGIFWGTWHGVSEEMPQGFRQTFKFVKMMIRPKSFVA
ncbi:fibroleukin [Ambystoma mexicanum]|uniref:fibroleukin n=1 Tax=Ambystoma mexicanum TaxID=8296 RepID=UPI0037E72DA1